MSSPSPYGFGTERHALLKAWMYSMHLEGGLSKHEIAKSLSMSCWSVRDIGYAFLSRSLHTRQTRHLDGQGYSQFHYRRHVSFHLSPAHMERPRRCMHAEENIFPEAPFVLTWPNEVVKTAPLAGILSSTRLVLPNLLSGSTRRADTNRGLNIYGLEIGVSHICSGKSRDEIDHTYCRRSPQFCLSSDKIQNREKFVHLLGFGGLACKIALIFLDGHGVRGGFNQEHYAIQVIVSVCRTERLMGKEPILSDGNIANYLSATDNPANPSWAKERCGIITWVAGPPSNLDFNIIANI